MSVGKESLVVLETLAQNQTRIYDDACDIGIWETPEITRQLKHAVAELASLEGIQIFSYINGVTVRTRLGFELDEGQVQGVGITVAKHYDRRARKSFYNISIAREQWSPSARLS